MKRLNFILVVFVVVVFAAATVYAAPRRSNKVFDNETMVGQIGIGYGMAGIYGDTAVPPISAAFEYGVKFAPKVPISFGGIIGYSRSEYKNQNWKWEYTYYLFGARAAYHFTELVKVPKLDLYAGVLLGYNYVSVSEPSNSSGYKVEGSYIMSGAYGGVRYYFADQLGVWSEIGYGIGFINVGLCYKFQ